MRDVSGLLVLLPCWPWLVACVLAVTPRGAVRGSAAFLALAGVCVTALLVPVTPGLDDLARLGIVLVSVGVALPWVLAWAWPGGEEGEVKPVPVFLAAGCVMVLCRGAGALPSIAVLGLAVFCVAAAELTARQRARPAWDRLVLHLAGIVLLLTAHFVGEASVRVVGLLGAVGACLLLGLGPQPVCEAPEAALAVALLRVGVLAVVARWPGQEIVGVAGLVSVWLAALAAVPRVRQVQVACGAVAAWLPEGGEAALIFGAMAVLLATVERRRDLAGLVRVGGGVLPPWPGFAGVLWVCRILSVEHRGMVLAFLGGLGVVTVRGGVGRLEGGWMMWGAFVGVAVLGVLAALRLGFVA